MEKTLVPLRPYQKEFCGNVWRAFYLGLRDNDPVDRAVAVMATGGGKTRCSGALADRVIDGRHERVCFVVDTDVLARQASNALHEVTGKIPTIEKAADYANLDAPLCIASIQSLSKNHRLDRFPRDHFGMLIGDECHLSVTPAWRRTFDHFNAKILGITATPDRADKKSIMEIFDLEAVNIPLQRLIREGWLAPITVKQVPLEIDLSSVGTKSRDLDPEDLDSALEPFFDAIAAAIKEHAPERKILTFCPLIKTSEAFVRACERNGINARHVDGKTTDSAEILQGFRDRRFQLLSNAMLLNKGYDDPTIDCVIILRVTESRSLYQQMVGRGTRKADGKTDLLILDFLWTFGEMMKPKNIMTPAHLMADNQESASDIAAILKAAGGQMDLMDMADDVRRQREERLMEEIRRKAKRRKKVKTFDFVTYIATTGNAALAQYEPISRSEKAHVTNAQTNLLVKIGVNPDAIATRGHASAIIGDWIDRKDKGLANVKQLSFLDRLGVRPRGDIGFHEASELIDATLRGRR